MDNQINICHYFYRQHGTYCDRTAQYRTGRAFVYAGRTCGDIGAPISI